MATRDKFCISEAEGHGHNKAIVKYYKSSTGTWFEIWLNKTSDDWPLRGLRTDSRIAFILSTAAEKHDCNQCKHQLACLIDQGCYRLFESK